MTAVKRALLITAGAAALALWAMVATAHHSAAQFDFGKRVTIQGVVKDFHVRNPHTEAIIEVKDEKGTRNVAYEGHSASHFYRAGYRRGMINPGDKIAILIAPRKDGADGGFIQAFTVNGKTVGFGGLSPETGQPLQKNSGDAAKSAG